MVERLQAKASSIGRILTSLEKKYSSTHGDESEIKKSPSGQLLSNKQPPSKRAHLKIQQIPPFNANKIRKSPSSDTAEKQQIQVIESPKEPLQDVQEEPPKTVE